jgi:FtsP/CotA-like multicopper oxidase with cupredoxin domain
MASNKISRRDFLQVLGVGSAAMWLSSCLPKGINQSLLGKGKESLFESPDIEISLKAVPDQLNLFDGKATSVWRYQGEVLQGHESAIKIIPRSYLGPILNLQKGQNVRIHFTNELPESSIIHWHGLHVPVAADGHPRLAIDPGETYIYDFTVADRAGTYWYHPHPHGRTANQVYAGLAGLIVIHDDEELGLGLPSGEYDLPLVIQDRRFNDDNQLSYDIDMMMDQMMGFLGNQILINGMPDFHLPVKTHPYRLRLLNGSNSRIYKLAWQDGTPLTVLGTDGGLLEKPVQRDYITLAPGQRLELWVDFSKNKAGESKQLVSLPFNAFGGEAAYAIFAAEIEQEVSHAFVLPKQLTAIAGHDAADAVNQKSPRSIEMAMGHGRGWTLNGRTFDMKSVARDEIVKLGDLEVWEFENVIGNGMGMMGGMNLPHPMHIHGLQFQVLERQISTAGLGAWETLQPGFVDEGWHDTVLVMPGEKVKVLLKFEDFTGLYLYHCHNLEHEDMGMMRNYRVDA